ncbi:hypothetical protein D3C73_1346060 [compost metagenome]
MSRITANCDTSLVITSQRLAKKAEKNSVPLSITTGLNVIFNLSKKLRTTYSLVVPC